MRTIRIPFFSSGEDIIKEAEKHSKHKKFTFAQWPDGSIRLIFNGTVNPDPEDFNED